MKEIMESWRKTLITESGFPRIANMLMGAVPNVHTVGFITAENPDGNQLNPQENQERNKLLQERLRERNLGYIRIKGKFGNLENSFLVPNITKPEIMNLGKDFGQESVIWGYKRDDESMRFQYIEGYKVVQERDVALVGSGVQDREDFYSQERHSSGRKFIIPFFDEDYEIVEESNQPVINGDINEEDALVKEIRIREEKLQVENKTPKYYWHHRGILNSFLSKLKKNSDSS